MTFFALGSFSCPSFTCSQLFYPLRLIYFNLFYSFCTTFPSSSAFLGSLLGLKQLTFSVCKIFSLRLSGSREIESQFCKKAFLAFDLDSMELNY